MNAHSSGDLVAESMVPCPVERDGSLDPVVLESMDLSGDTFEASFHSNVDLVVESAATRHLSDAAAANTPRPFAEAGTPTLSVADPIAKNDVQHTDDFLESCADLDTGNSGSLEIQTHSLKESEPVKLLAVSCEKSSLHHSL